MNYLRLVQANKIARKTWNRFYRWTIGVTMGNFLPPIGRYRKVRTPCSCYMCGNPRKHFKEKTIQERRHDDSRFST